MTTVPPGAERGFVRVPRAYMELDMSPGARCLVLFLCASANDHGESWHSYANIGKMLGRSKASITAYVSELVRIGIVEAIEQKMANGYNYRRRLKLSQWREYLAGWREMTRRKKSPDINSKDAASEAEGEKSSPTEVCSAAPDDAPARRPSSLRRTECGVQPAECKDPSGPNENHQNNTPDGKPAAVEWSDDDEREWRRFRPHDRDPISVKGPLPRPEIGRKLAAMEADLRRRLGLFAPGEARTRSEAALRAFARSHRLSADPDALDECAEALADLVDNAVALESGIRHLDAIWKPHWRRLPSPSQIRQSLVAAPRSTGPDRELRQRYAEITMRRWIYGRSCGNSGIRE